MGKRVPVRTKAKSRGTAHEHVVMLDRTPERVMAYFQGWRERYVV